MFGQDAAQNMKHHPAKYLSFYLLDIANWILVLRTCINTTQNVSLPFLIKWQVNSCLRVTSKIFSFTEKQFFCLELIYILAQTESIRFHALCDTWCGWRRAARCVLPQTFQLIFKAEESEWRAAVTEGNTICGKT